MLVFAEPMVMCCIACRFGHRSASTSLRICAWLLRARADEALEEIARIRAAPTPEEQKIQARDRVRARQARFRVRKRRIVLRSMIGLDN